MELSWVGFELGWACRSSAVLVLLPFYRTAVLVLCRSSYLSFYRSAVLALQFSSSFCTGGSEACAAVEHMAVEARSKAELGWACSQLAVL